MGPTGEPDGGHLYPLWVKSAAAERKLEYFATNMVEDELMDGPDELKAILLCKHHFTGSFERHFRWVLSCAPGPVERVVKWMEILYINLDLCIDKT